MMAAAYSSRDIVEDYLHYKLLDRGLEACSVLLRRHPTGVQRRHHATPSWRSERAVTSHREDTSEDTQQGSCLTPPRLQAVMRYAGDDLQQRYHGDLTAHVSVLLQCNGGGAEQRHRLMVVREELFRDGVNWGRIMAMMELGGALCSEVIQRGEAWQVDDIAGWMEESLDSPPLQRWIEDNGGWDAFVESYDESRPPSRFWSLRSVFRLAVLVALGITLGALFTQR